MKNIIALIDDKSDREIVIDSAVDLAQLLNLEVTLCHLVFAPSNWEQLNRTCREQHPNTRIKINEARLLMDKSLREIRLNNVKAKKQFLYYNSNIAKHNLDFHKDGLIVMQKTFLMNRQHYALRKLLFHLETSKMILDKPLETTTIAEIVLASNFYRIKPETSRFINKLYSCLFFNLNLVFINTKEKQENSDISIKNMKQIIAENGFSRTRISIFYSDRKLGGAEKFAEMKGGDLIILECTQRITNHDLKKLKTPIIIINKCVDEMIGKLPFKVN